MYIGGRPPPPPSKGPAGSGWAQPPAAPVYGQPSYGQPIYGAPVAPQLPASISRYPSWQTVPVAGPPTLAQNVQSTAADVWRRVRGIVSGLAASEPETRIMGYGANTVASTSYTIYAERVVALVNRERSIRGLPPLSVKAGLSWVATKRSVDMIQRNYFAHVDPSGHDAYYYLRKEYVRYGSAGENIASGQQTPEEVVAAWMNSPGHRANILNPYYRCIGVGIARAMDNTKLWTQLFSD